MSFLKSKGFKYLKNLIIGVGAAVVLLGALFKLESWEGASTMLQIGLFTEAGIFLFLGLIGPDKDYYWEKLYPGLDSYSSNIAPLSAGEAGPMGKALDGEAVEGHLSNMVGELQTMSGSLSSLKALQEVDFSNTKDQISSMNNFYTQLNSAMENLASTTEDAQKYKENMAALNQNLGSLNGVYGNMLSAMNPNRTV